MQQIEPTPQARLEVLRDLGYAFSDFDLWDGWLILEEASAERIIRDYLVPWFAPRLARVRTLSANGANKIEPTFDDFHRLVLFTHLEEAYRDAAWVRVDGDALGQGIAKNLRQRFPSWSPDRFGFFAREDFEWYYPCAFHHEVGTVLAIPDRQDRRIAKRELLNKVRTWIDEDEERGKRALAESASDVIQDLQRIQVQLASRSSPT